MLLFVEYQLNKMRPFKHPSLLEGNSKSVLNNIENFPTLLSENSKQELL